MTQFYVSSDDDLRLCKQSRTARTPTTITGLTASGRYRLFTGTLRFIEDDQQPDEAKRWLVTMQTSSEYVHT